MNILMTVAIALLLTSLLGYTIETIKIKIIKQRLHIINTLLKNELSEIMVSQTEINIFLIGYIRSMIQTNYLKQNIVDGYEIYKLDNCRIHVKFLKGTVTDEVKFLLTEGKINLIHENIINEDELLEK